LAAGVVTAGRVAPADATLDQSVVEARIRSGTRTRARINGATARRLVADFTRLL